MKTVALMVDGAKSGSVYSNRTRILYIKKHHLSSNFDAVLGKQIKHILHSLMLQRCYHVIILNIVRGYPIDTSATHYWLASECQCGTQFEKPPLKICANKLMGTSQTISRYPIAPTYMMLGVGTLGLFLGRGLGPMPKSRSSTSKSVQSTDNLIAVCCFLLVRISSSVPSRSHENRPMPLLPA